MTNDKKIDKNLYVLLKYKNDIREELLKTIQDNDSYYLSLLYVANIAMVLDEDYQEAYIPLFHYIMICDNAPRMIEEFGFIDTSFMKSFIVDNKEEFVDKTKRYLSKVGLLFRFDNKEIKQVISR